MSKPSVQKTVAISDIRTNPVALRELQKDSEAYHNLVADIGRRGILLPITVMEKTDEATNEVFYQIIDGLHRFSGACDNNLEAIPGVVLDISENDVVETQIAANLVKVDTKPVEYTKALQRMFSVNPTLTVPELAERISQSTAFIMQRLSLLKLDPTIQKLVDQGEIKLANGYSLAKLPKEEQHEWTDRAMALPPAEFQPAVNARVKEIAEAKKTGRASGPVEYQAVARLRKLAEIKKEIDAATPEVGPALCAQSGVTTAAEGFALALKWVASLDVNSVNAGKQKWEAQRKASDEARKKAAAIREAKRMQESAEKAAKARAESGLTDEEIAAEIAKQEAEKKAAAPAAVAVDAE
jgi:ParB/RepB/Spo0J family partition protein